MQTELKPDINLIVIAGNVEVEGHQLVSRKFLQIINHVLTETELMTEAFQLDPECIRKIRLLPNFDDLGEEYENKYGFFKASTKEIGINLKGNFAESVDAVKEGEGAEFLSLRAHLWYQMLTTMFHEFAHAVLFAIDPDIAEKAREEVEDSIAEDALEEMAAFVMNYDSEPPAWANEPFFGILFMDFMINEVRDNAEAWALAQKDIHEYNERNNTRIVWKEDDTAVQTFRRWFKVSNEYTDWDESYSDLVELKFSMPVPPVENIITDDTLMKPSDEIVEALHEALKDDIIEETAVDTITLDTVFVHEEASPFNEGDAGAADREALVGGEMVKKAEETVLPPMPTAPVKATSINNYIQELADKAILEATSDEDIVEMFEWTEPDDVVQDREAIKGMKEEDFALTPDEMDHMGSEDVEESNFDDYGDGESHLYDEEVLPEFPTPGPKTEHFTGAGTGQYAPPTETVLPPAPEKLPTETEAPTFAPNPGPAPPTGATPLPESTQQTMWPSDIPPPQAPAPQPAAEAPVYNNQALRTGLPNHNFTGEQMKVMCEEVFKRCVNHIFTKCGWTPGMNPSFVAELRGAIMEPISMSGIPDIDKFLIGLDITDPATGQYIVNSPYTAHGGMIKGKITKNQGLPSYTLYFNYNGMEIKRFIAPQNQWKVNKAGTGYSAPAVSAQRGAQIAWVMDGADDSSQKWRCKFENGVLQWFV